MKLNLTLSKLASIVGGSLLGEYGEEKINSFVTDSRVISQGDAFWALKGQTHDGHHFIEEVVAKGAKVGCAPECAEDPGKWGIAVLGPNTKLAENEIVPAKTMLDKNHQGV